MNILLQERWLLILLILGILAFVVLVISVLLRRFNERLTYTEVMWQTVAERCDVPYRFCPNTASEFYTLTKRHTGLLASENPLTWNEVVEHEIRTEVAGFTVLIEDLSQAGSSSSEMNRVVASRGAVAGALIGVDGSFSVQKKGFLSSFSSDYELGDEAFDSLFQVKCATCEEGAVRLLNHAVRKALLNLSRVVSGLVVNEHGVSWEIYTHIDDTKHLWETVQAMSDLAVALREANQGQGGGASWEEEHHEVSAEAESAVLV